MIYLGLHEGFTFDQACEGALEELKKQIDIKTIHTPIRFFYSGVKYN